MLQAGALLPASGLFHLNDDPGHPYLVETDPAINTYTGFLGSAYLLAHLGGWAPDITQRRLGDSYYELMLIRESLLALTGSRFLDQAIADEKAQFEFLMQNAVAASDALHLSPGIALSREQIDALQSDIVWMEERVVAEQKVLVPVVYLAQGSSRLLREGTVIGGGSLSIEAGRFTNNGLVQAQDDLRLQADGDILNRRGSLQAGGNLIAQSGGDFRNESGQLSATNILLQADGDITHQTDSSRHTSRIGATTSTYTNVGDTASVTASGQIVQLAGGDLRLQGAAISGDNVALLAGGDIAMDTVEVVQGRRYTAADWQMAEEQVRHLQTEVEAISDIRLAAGADLQAIAASLREEKSPDWAQVATSLPTLPATNLAAGADVALTAARLKAGGAIDLAAGGSLYLLAAEESDHYEEHRQDNGSFSDKSFDLVHDESRLLGTYLDAGGKLALKAKNDITLYASSAEAKGAATVEAGGTINLIAGVNTTQHSEESRKSSEATFNNHSEGYVMQEAVASGIRADGDLNLNAGSNINLIASSLKSEQTLRIGGSVVDQEALALAADTGAEASPKTLPLNLNVGTLALTNTSWNETQKGFSGPLEELVKVASFATALMLAPYTLGQVDLPEVKIGEHSSTRTQDVWQAGSTLAAQDMAIRVQNTAAFIGATVTVPGTLAISAQDIVIDAAAETHANRHEAGSDTVQGLGAELDKDKGEYRVAGVQEAKTSVSDSERITEWRGTRIDAGNLILNAEKHIDILGSQLNVIGDALVEAGGNLTIGGREGSVTQEHQETTETITVAVAARNAYVDAALAVKGLAEAADALKDAKGALDAAERKAAQGLLDSSDLDYFRVNVAAAATNLVQAEIAAAGAVVAMGTTGGTGGFYASGSAQREKSVTTTTSEQSHWQGSTLKVGGSAALLAGDTIAVKGSDVIVDKTALTGADASDTNRNLLIVDAKRIQLTAGEEYSRQSRQARTEQEGLSVSANNRAGVTGGGVSLGYRESEADSSALHYVNSHLVAGTVSSRSEALRLAGAVVEADDVDIDTGALTVQSLQDAAYSKSRSYGLNTGFGFGAGTNANGGLDTAMTSGSGGLDFLRSDSERRWVAEQSGIIGHDSLVVAARDTVLTGGLIANARRDASGRLVDQGGLDFSTDTLVIHHLQDVDRSKTVGANMGVSVAVTPTNPGQGTTGNQPLTPAQLTAAQTNQTPTPETPRGTVTQGGTYFGHVTEQLTQATLGGGSVKVGGQRLGDGSEGTVTAASLGLGALNWELSQAQLITTDEDIGGLNFVATMDLRWVTPEGRADLWDEQKAAAGGMMKLAASGIAAPASLLGVVMGAYKEGQASRGVVGMSTAVASAGNFAADNIQAAAALDAYRDGDYNTLANVQAASDALATQMGMEGDLLLVSTLSPISRAGTTDGTDIYIDVARGLRSSTIETVGHDVGHVLGIEDEWLADMMGWATGLAFDGGLLMNSRAISAARPVDSVDLAGLYRSNVALLSANNEQLANAMTANPEGFQNSAIKGMTLTRAVGAILTGRVAEISRLPALEAQQDARIAELTAQNLKQAGLELVDGIQSLPATAEYILAHPEILADLPAELAAGVASAQREYRGALAAIGAGAFSSEEATLEAQAQAEARILADLIQLLAGAGAGAATGKIVAKAGTRFAELTDGIRLKVLQPKESTDANAARQARINNNADAEMPGFGSSAQRDFKPGSIHRAENINSGQVTDRDGLQRVDEFKDENDRQLMQKLGLDPEYWATQRAAWKEGTVVIDRVAISQETYRMVLDEDAYKRILDAFDEGNYAEAVKNLGNWATKDPIRSSADVRNNLAISSEWKGRGGKPMYVIEFTVKPGVGLREGTVGPMWDKNVNLHLPGGGHQVQFMHKTPRQNPDLYVIDPSNIRRLP